MKTWTATDIPSQRGRLAVITGATGGLGYETALALAGAGAQLVLTGRNPIKGAAALESIRAVHPSAAISYETLDLGSLASVHDFAERFKRKHESLQILVNNGGVMAPPKRHVTADGFELLFTFELQRRSDAHGFGLLSLAAHPGLASTALFGNGQRLGGNVKPGWLQTVSGWLPSMLAQSASDGALSTLYAATSPTATKAGYYGPTGFMELKGPVGEATVAPRARDHAVAAELWKVSEALTGVQWPTEPAVVARVCA